MSNKNLYHVLRIKYYAKKLNTYYKIHNTFSGFTMIELLVSISIVAVIASIGFVVYNKSQAIGRDSRRKADLRALQVAIELYIQDASTSPKVYPYQSGGGCTDPVGVGCFSTTGGNWVPNVPAPTYINTVPLDPINSSTYRYSYKASAGGSSYTLCAALENTSDPDIKPTGSNPCEAGGYFSLTPP